MAKVQEIGYASIDAILVNAINNNHDEWMEDLFKFLTDGEALSKEDRARKVRLRAPRFEVKEGRLYKQSYGGSLLRCVESWEAKEIMDEVHDCTCSAYQGSNTLYRRILLQGYYWPSMRIDCERKVKACKVCQVFTKRPRRQATFINRLATSFLSQEGGYI